MYIFKGLGGAGVTFSCRLETRLSVCLFQSVFIKTHLFQYFQTKDSTGRLWARTVKDRFIPKIVVKVGKTE